MRVALYTATLVPFTTECVALPARPNELTTVEVWESISGARAAPAATSVLMMSTGVESVLKAANSPPVALAAPSQSIAELIACVGPITILLYLFRFFVILLLLSCSSVEELLLK